MKNWLSSLAAGAGQVKNQVTSLARRAPYASESSELDNVADGRRGRTIDVRVAATCKDKARALVHKYAAFGTAWAVLPIPVATSIGLTAMETHLIYWVGRIYGEHPSSGDVAMTAAGLELASVALKTVAIEGANYLPVVGWGIKGAIAGSAIEGIGALVIDHYEKRYPGRLA